MATQVKTMQVKSDVALAETTTKLTDMVTFDVSKLPNGITYKGPKAVLSFADPIEWNKASTYDALTVVWDEATLASYASKRPVPPGIEITNGRYWLRMADGDAQIEIYRQEVLNYANDLETLEKLSIRFFTNTAEMSESTELFNGCIVKTAGFYTKNDMGGAFYRISDSEIANGMDVIQCKNFVAVLIDQPTINNLGAKTNADFDNSNIINYSLNTYNSAIFGRGVYKVFKPIIIDHDNCTIRGVSPSDTIVRASSANANALEINNSKQNYIYDITFSGDYEWNGTIGGGNASTGNGCVLNSATQCNFINVNFSDNGKNGIYFGLKSWANNFNNCNFFRNKLNGVDVIGESEAAINRTASTLQFDNCYFRYNTIGLNWQGILITLNGGVIEGNNIGFKIIETTLRSESIYLDGVDFEGNNVANIDAEGEVYSLLCPASTFQFSGNGNSIKFGSHTYYGVDFSTTKNFNSKIEVAENGILFIRGVTNAIIGANNGIIYNGLGLVQDKSHITIGNVTDLNTYDAFTGTITLDAYKQIAVHTNFARCKLTASCSNHFSVGTASFGKEIYSSFSTTVEGKETVYDVAGSFIIINPTESKIIINDITLEGVI